MEILARKFQGIILWSKGRTSSKLTICGCAGDDLMCLAFLLYALFMTWCYYPSLGSENDSETDNAHSKCRERPIRRSVEGKMAR